MALAYFAERKSLDIKKGAYVNAGFILGMMKDDVLAGAPSKVLKQVRGMS